MSKRLHSRSPVARRTAGITLDHAAPLYDWLAPLMTLGSEHRLHRQVVARLALDRPAAVLDVGCGTGALTRQIYDALPADSPRRVCGVDAAEAMIAVAGRKAGPRPGLEFVPALAEELPWPGASFDRVLSTFFFHHLNYGLKIRSLAEIWRVLELRVIEHPRLRIIEADVTKPDQLAGVCKGIEQVISCIGITRL
ncbi:MAG: class I SAM-dependent methyltransferase, partial [Kiritimatiellae bacterium]|nr:class I SAM-dependent methyltransferase [Kiritimatiellia bacterium]